MTPRALGEQNKHSCIATQMYTVPVIYYYGLKFLYCFQPIKRTGIYATDLFTQEAIKKINAHDASEPMFLYLAHQAVHSANKNDPLQAPEQLIKVTP